jgi:hypothetical protein
LNKIAEKQAVEQLNVWANKGIRKGKRGILSAHQSNKSAKKMKRSSSIDEILVTTTKQVTIPKRMAHPDFGELNQADFNTITEMEL